MLTGFQIERIGYLADGEFLCRPCVVDEYEELEAGDGQESQSLDAMSWAEDDEAVETVLGHTPYDRYSLDESFPEGLDCGRCGREIVEAAEDYCRNHDSWRAFDPEQGELQVCEAGIEDEDCEFPSDVNPNPPVPRWVPCGICGAGDGQPHDEQRHIGVTARF